MQCWTSLTKIYLDIFYNTYVIDKMAPIGSIIEINSKNCHKISEISNFYNSTGKVKRMI